MIPTEPSKITDKNYRFDSFTDGEAFPGKLKKRLPPMGWNSWNAFGTGNTEELTKAMADKMIELGLDKLGYQYLVLDDGCYKSERINGKLVSEPVRFPGGFKLLSDYIHSLNLKFGMYNDIGIKLCSGATVGTCGFEATDAKAYIDWGVDFLKIDNCYYLWDNATFSNPENVRYVFAPNIKEIRLLKGSFSKSLSADKGILKGSGAELKNGYVSGIGTFDGTNTGRSPVGPMSSELVFELDADEEGDYELILSYASGRQIGTGEWIQIAAGPADAAPSSDTIFFDGLLPPSESTESFINSSPIKITLQEGKNKIRLMNHRRQENTLCSYATMRKELYAAKPDHEILLSLCEWGKTQPQNWGYKVGNSWRILNDITFRVGSDGDPGFGAWTDPGTPSVTSQYNKAVIMDQFAGLDKGWNDPDMLMVGMKGLTTQMNQTHFTMWCMMNSPLMLGLDLRRMEKGDELYNIIANRELIALNQDPLGLQAKRIFTSGDLNEEGAYNLDAKDSEGRSFTPSPDTAYLQNCDRLDILAKPLADGSLALAFFNLSQEKKTGSFSVDTKLIKKFLGNNLPDKFYTASNFLCKDLWTGEKKLIKKGIFSINEIEGCGNVTLKITVK